MLYTYWGKMQATHCLLCDILVPGKNEESWNKLYHSTRKLQLCATKHCVFINVQQIQILKLCRRHQAQTQT